MNESQRLDRLMNGVENIAAFCREHGKPLSPALIYQHRQGMKPISLEAAVVYARAFGVSLEEISPRLAELVASVPDVSTPGQEIATYLKAKVTRLRANEPTPLQAELLKMCEGISDRGVAELIGAARVIAQNHPKQAVKNRRS